MSRPTRTAEAARWCIMWVRLSLQPPSFGSSQQGQILACCLLHTAHSISLDCIMANKQDDQFPQSLRDRRQTICFQTNGTDQTVWDDRYWVTNRIFCIHLPAACCTRPILSQGAGKWKVIPPVSLLVVNIVPRDSPHHR